VSSHVLAIPNESNSQQAYATDFKSKVSSNEHRAFVARQTGISRHIRFNEREGAQSSSVLAKAINAIIGVVFLDCGGDINVVLRTMRHLGLVRLALL
jgi:dsRNA-specific ribonuclease